MTRRSIIDVAGGSLLELLDRELEKVIYNIQDLNTDDKERTINLNIKIKPQADNQRNLLVVNANASSKVRPSKKVQCSFATTKRIDKDGNVSYVLQEIMNEPLQGQINIDGEIIEAPDPILIGGK